MRTLAPKQYQTDVLASVEKYFRAIHEEPQHDAEMAFLRVTKELWGKKCSYNWSTGIS